MYTNGNHNALGEAFKPNDKIVPLSAMKYVKYNR